MLSPSITTSWNGKRPCQFSICSPISYCSRVAVAVVADDAEVQRVRLVGQRHLRRLRAAARRRGAVGAATATVATVGAGAAEQRGERAGEDSRRNCDDGCISESLC